MLDRVPTADSFADSPFGPGIEYRCRVATEPADYQLHADECALLTPRTVDKRRTEFRLGRAAAHHALRALLGTVPGPVLRGAAREPLWPDGVVGAITHAAEFAAAAVARAHECGGLGLDVEERNRSVGLEVLDRICTDAEADWVRDLPAQAELRMKLVFSAKESIFKALYPREQVFLGFHDAEVCWNDDTRAFDATLAVAAGAAYPVGYRLVVACRLTARLIMTSTALPPPR